MYKKIIIFLAVSIGLSYRVVLSANEQTPGLGNTGLEFMATVGFGYDSNIYKAPSNSYIDYAPTPGSGIPVDPEVYNGAYIPLEFDLTYTDQWTTDNQLVATYGYDGQLYVDRDYGNADTHSHRIDLGNRMRLSNSVDYENQLYVGVYKAHKRRLYLDRDTGDEQEYLDTQIDISQKYIYDVFGVEAEFEHDGKDLDFKIYYIRDARDYRDPASDDSAAANSKEYDYTYQKYGSEIDFKLNKATKFTLGYNTYSNDYDERLARNEDGRLLSSNPARKYDYDVVSLTLRYRFSRDLLAYLDYEQKQRSDLYVGYYDYSKDLYKVRVHYKLNKNHKLKFSYAIWERIYPNAFPFDRDWAQSGEHVWYDGVIMKFSSISKLSKNNTLKVEFKYEDEDTNDLRYDFERYQAVVSMEWEY